MEAIKGSQVSVPDAVFAWLLDGKGGVKPLEDDDVISREHPCWLHLNYTHPDSAQWLATTPLLPNNVRDALAGKAFVHASVVWVKGRLLRCAASMAARMSARTNWWRCVCIWMNG